MSTTKTSSVAAPAAPAADAAATGAAAQVPAEVASLRRLPAGRRAQRESQPDRRMNILLAAERLFAHNGFHAVSIRDIAAEAGVPLALVGYYFGAKHELYHAIFESWSGLGAKRMESLSEAVTEPDPARRLDRIIDAFIAPVLAMQKHPEGRYWSMMAARELAMPTPESDLAQRTFFDPLAHAFIDALMSTSPLATRGQVAWCYQFMLGALLHHLTDQRVERLSGGENTAVDPAASPLLAAFIGSGFRAVLAMTPPEKSQGDFHAPDPVAPSGAEPRR